VDISPLIRRQRMVKSAYEIEQIRRAAAILDETFAAIPELLRPGLTELELSAALEYRLRLLRHQGHIRLRNFCLEMFFGHVLSGHAGLEMAYTDTPSGGLGFSPAFPQGPSQKPLALHEPITVDIGSCVNGYVADMTRLFVIGDLPPEAWRAYDLTLELFQCFETEARPGVRPGDLYHKLWDLVDRAGLSDFFMGRGRNG
jgi:Xaa-Pro dipeptidase